MRDPQLEAGLRSGRPGPAMASAGVWRPAVWALVVAGVAGWWTVGMSSASAAEPSERPAAATAAEETKWPPLPDMQKARRGMAAKSRAEAATRAASSEPAAADDVFDGRQTSAIERIVRRYLLSNPKILLEVSRAYEVEVVKSLIDDAIAPIAGNPKGDVPVIEFFDYNCGYCRRAYQAIAELIADDPNVKVVFVELPILSKGSVEAARLSMAARLQDKYWPVHQALISMRGVVDARSALATLSRLDIGLDMARLLADANSPAVTKALARMQDVAQQLGISSTPYFRIGDGILKGAGGDLLAKLKGGVDTARNGECRVC